MHEERGTTRLPVVDSGGWIWEFGTAILRHKVVIELVSGLLLWFLLELPDSVTVLHAAVNARASELLENWLVQRLCGELEQVNTSKLVNIVSNS